MARRIDFTSNAPIYDRRHGDFLAPRFAQRLTRAGTLKMGARVLDVGAGTGRVAIALARLGCEVLALDPAVAMLNALKRKSGRRSPSLIVAESGALPFPNHSVDAVVLARILYLLADWRAALRAACDVLKPGGVVFHEWGNGEAHEPWVQVREKARALFQEAGIANPFHPGARSESEVDAHVNKLGLVRTKQLDAGPGPPMTLRDFLNKIESGELSYVWNVPSTVKDTCLRRLRLWCEQKFEIERPMRIPESQVWVIYAKAAYGREVVRQR